MLFSKLLPISKNLNIIGNANKLVIRSQTLGILQVNLKYNVYEKGLHSCVTNSITPQENAVLEPNSPIVIAVRNTTFFSRISATALWKGVTGVSNAGRKRGRGKASRKMWGKNLNKGQYIGEGEENILWPGLNAPVTKGKEIVRQVQLPKDENRMKKLVELRDSMGKFKPLRLNPLERGWSGTKMPGRSIGPPDPIGEDNFKGFDTLVLENKTVKTMTPAGQRRRISTFVVTGNKNGLAGFGLAKGNIFEVSARRSKNIAGQRLIYIERCDGHTVFHDFYCEFMHTKIFVKRKPRGYGLVCHRAIREICKVIGIENLHAKVEGSINIQNLTKAFFMGLLNQKSHQQLAEEKQLYVAKLREGTHPEVVATPTNGDVRSNKDIDMDEEMDFRMYCMDGKMEIERKPFVPFYVHLPSWETHLKRVLKNRNHDKIHRQQLLEYGAPISFLTEKYPECDGNFRPKKDDN